MKKPIFKYGVEIKKPWSKEMYEHNDNVAEEARENIKVALNNAFDAIINNHKNQKFREIGKEISGYSFGEGYSEDDVLEETLCELEKAPNYWLKEAYEALRRTGHVKKLEPGFIGFETKKELEYLKNNQDDANMVSNW